MIFIFNLLSIFDWITPIVEGTKDLDYNITDRRPKMTIWVESGNEDRAKDALRIAGFRVISTTRTSHGNAIGIDTVVLTNESLTDACQVLSSHGIKNRLAGDFTTGQKSW